MRFNKKIAIPLFLLAVIAAVSFYVWAEDHKDEKEENVLEYLERFNEVLIKVKDYYVEEKSYEGLIDAAIKGMLKELDVHSAYLSEHQYENLTIDTKGEFGGLGIQISIRDNYPTVISPIEGTPAYRLGIQGGDKIIEIEGESTKGWVSEQAVSKLRGDPGTQVNITIGREGKADSIYYTITREIIRVPSITYSGTIGEIGYIRITRFAEKTAKEINEIIRGFEKGGIKGLILDFRWNPGGLLTSARDVSDLFLDKNKLIVNTESRIPQHNQRFVSNRRNFHEGYPIVVLINAASASASEIVAGALQDWDRAVIVGQTSFGKGSVQTVFRIGDSSALKLTTQRWFTPIGRSIHRDELPGEMASIGAERDIEREEYRTASGRVVYGGGGITPDWELELPEFTDFQRKLELESVFFSFAVHFMAYNEVGEDFEVDSDVLSEFREFLSTKEIEFGEEEWNEENTHYVEIGIKREVFRKLYGTRGAYLATLPEDEEINRVLEMFRQAPTLPEMFDYIEKQNELARTEDK